MTKSTFVTYIFSPSKTFHGTLNLWACILYLWSLVFLAKKKDPQEHITILCYKAVLELSRPVSARIAALGRGNQQPSPPRSLPEGLSCPSNQKPFKSLQLCTLVPWGFSNLY